MSTRDKFDGLPYYCGLCGADPDEMANCHVADLADPCRLETKQAAEARQRRRRPMTTSKVTQGKTDE